MRNLWLEAFAICLLFVITQASTEQVVCRNCEGYQICGLKTSRTPDCPNGFPCTKEQYQLCTKIAMAGENGKCDRPGVFAESTSPNKFYTCKIKDESLKFEKKPITCLGNTTFDLSTLKCLSENEKNLLKVAKELTVAYRDTRSKFYCIKTGTFPDPYDCKMYHVCNSKLESQDFYCPLGTYFDGKNCTTKNTEQCIQQFKKQFRDQVLQAKALFQNVKDLLIKTSPTPRKFKSSASLVSPGVIKRTFYDKNKTKYTYFGIKENSNSSNYNNTKSDTQDFEKFVETIIAQLEMEKNSSVILSELKSASKNIIGTYVQNTTLVASESGRKLHKNKNPNKPKNCKRKITLNRVTIIFITQNNCESCSSCQTAEKPLAGGNIPNSAISQEEFSSSKPPHSEAYSHLKATTLDTQHLFGITKLDPGIKGTDSTLYTNVSKSPLPATNFIAEDIRTSSSADFEPGTTFFLTSTSREFDVGTSTKSKEIISSDKEFSSKTDLEREMSLTKGSTSWHSPFSTSSEFEDELLGNKEAHAHADTTHNPAINSDGTTLYLGTESTVLKMTTLSHQQFSSTNISDSEADTGLVKTSSNEYSDKNSFEQGMTFSHEKLSSSNDSNLETENAAIKTRPSPFFDFSADTQSVETDGRTNLATQFSNTESATEPLKTTSLGDKLSISPTSIKTSVSWNVTPLFAETISGGQETFINTTFQSELGTDQLEIETTETPHSGLNKLSTNIIQPPASISSSKIEDLTLKSQNEDLELESPLKTMSNIQNFEGNTYPDLRGTTPLIHTAKGLESATVSVSSIFTQQQLDISTTASNKATAFVENNYRSSTLEPEKAANPAFTGISSTSDSMKTIHSNQGFVHSIQEKESGIATLTALNTTQISYVSLYPDSQNISFIAQNLPSNKTLLSGTTKISTDLYSDIGTSKITKLPSYNPSSQVGTITEVEVEAVSMIESSPQDIRNKITPYTEENGSTGPYSSSTQTSESTNSVIKDLQNSEIIQSEKGTTKVSVSTPLFLDINKGAYPKITTSPTSHIYGSSETKSAITAADFDQHPFVNNGYSTETIPPNQGVFSSTILDSDTDSGMKKVTSSQHPHSDQNTNVENTIFTTPKSEAVHISEKFSTGQDIDFVKSQLTKLTSSNQNSYASESSQVTETTSNKNVNSSTIEKETDKMNSKTAETFSTSTLQKSTAANSIIQGQHISGTLEPERITPSIQISTNQHTVANTSSQSVQSAQNQELFSNTVFSSETEPVSTKPYNGPLPQSGDSTFAIQNLDMNTVGEAGKTTPLISRTEALEPSTKMHSTSTSEKPGKQTDLYEAFNGHHDPFSSIPQSIKATPYDQGQMSSTVIKLETGTTLTKVNISQHPHVMISPLDTISTIEDDQNSPTLESEIAPPTTKVTSSLYSEKHSSIQPIQITTSGKEYFGGGDSETGSLLLKTSTNEETNFFHSEGGTFPKQKPPIGTALDSSSADQFSYTNSFIQSIKTTSEGYSSSGALHPETSTNRGPDVSATSGLEDTAFSNQSMNNPESLLSETENDIIETSAHQFSGKDSFTHLTKTTSAEQASDYEAETVFIKASTKKSDEIALLNQELLNSTMSDSSGTSQIFYTDPSIEYIKPNSADQEHSTSTGSNLETEFTVIKTYTNSFNQFKEVPSADQEFSSSTPSDIKITPMKTSTNGSSYPNSFKQPTSVDQEFSSGLGSESEKEPDVMNPKITSSESESEAILTKSNTSWHPYTSTSLQLKNSSTGDNIRGPSALGLVPQTTLTNKSTGQYSDTDFSAESKQMTLSEEALPDSVALESKKDVTLNKTTTSLHFDNSKSPEMEGTTLGVQDIHNGFALSGIDTTYLGESTNQFIPGTNSFTLHFKTTLADQGTSGGTASELGKDITVTKLGDRQIQTDSSPQYVDTSFHTQDLYSFSSLDTETKNATAKVSTPLNSGWTDTEHTTTFPHSYMSTSPQSLAAASQTQSPYSTPRLNSERQSLSLKISNAEHLGGNMTLHSTKTNITKASTTKYSDFNELPYLKEKTPPDQNIDGGTTEGTRTVSTKYSSDETFHTSKASPPKSMLPTQHHHTSTILEPDRTVISETTTKPHTNKIHSINNASGTSGIYSTPTSASQLSSKIALQKISTSQKSNTSPSFNPKATTSIRDDLDVSMSEESETTTTLTKTNTSHSPDFSKTTVLKKATSPLQETKTVSKKINSIQTILNSKTFQSGNTATATTAPSQHPYISIPYSKGAASPTQNIHHNVSVESETSTLPKKFSSADYFNFSIFQTQNINFGPTPQASITTITSNKITNAQNLKISASNTTRSVFYNTSKPFLEKITVPTSVTQYSNTSMAPPSTAIIFSAKNLINNKTSHTLSRGPSASTFTTPPFSASTLANASTATLSNASSNLFTNKSTFHYSNSSILPHSKETVFLPEQNVVENIANKMTTLQQKETSFDGEMQISTTLRPVKNLKSDSKRKSKDKSKGNSKNKSKNNLKMHFRKKEKAFHCSSVGLFRDPNDCHSYYSCRFVSVTKKNCPFCKSKRWKLIATHKKCEDGKWFSALFWRCVKIRPLLC